MEICVFQGTFNPIHNAHLRVADFLVNKYDFDKFIFIPAFNPPHKNTDLSFSKHRYNMVKLAVEDNPKFEISDIEYKREGKSYTYLTICQLREYFNITGRINFTIGTDAFKHIESWYEFDKLKEIVKFIVFVREDKFHSLEYDYLKDKGVVFEFQPLSFEDVSSTQLREDIRQNKDISEYVPKKVEEYIRENGLYQD